MKKILAAVLALSLSIVVGAAFAADAAKPAAAPAAKKEVKNLTEIPQGIMAKAMDLLHRKQAKAPVGDAYEGGGR